MSILRSSIFLGVEEEMNIVLYWIMIHRSGLIGDATLFQWSRYFLI